MCKYFGLAQKFSQKRHPNKVFNVLKKIVFDTIYLLEQPYVQLNVFKAQNVPFYNQHTQMEKLRIILIDERVLETIATNIRPILVMMQMAPIFTSTLGMEVVCFQK